MAFMRKQPLTISHGTTHLRCPLVCSIIGQLNGLPGNFTFGSGFMKSHLVRLYQDGVSAWQQLRVFKRFLGLTHMPRRNRSRANADRQGECVIISMTSHGNRLNACYWAVLSLITQDVEGPEVHLWLQETDRFKVPHRLQSLQQHGLHIHYLAEDYGPATKLLPSLKAWPTRTIITADDDAIYERSWLRGLLAARDTNPESIVCYRTHRMRYRLTGDVAPYSDWELMTPISGIDDSHFFTGVGGVLYPPTSLHPQVLDVELLKALSIRNDDIWFNWMARLQGTSVLRIPGRPNRWFPVLGTRGNGLFQENTEKHGNDAILHLIEAFQNRSYP